MTAVTGFVCHGCGFEAQVREPLPFTCECREERPAADHVLEGMRAALPEWPVEEDENPFLRYRRFQSTYHFARAHGFTDEAYVQHVKDLEGAIEAVDGSRMHRSALAFDDHVNAFFKEETQQVSGSHKARHLMAIALQLTLAEKLSLVDLGSRPLAIASCGNAALAAAVLAAAMGKRLQVYLPRSADSILVDHIEALDARLNFCERRPSDPPGDPCTRRFQQAVARGAVPFSVQGRDNALAIEGGLTLGLELIDQLRAAGRPWPMHLVVQVGGGALLSSLVQAFEWGLRSGVCPHMPRLHAVQTPGCHPLKHAFERVLTREREEGDGLAFAIAHRDQVMKPWQQVPRSLATGILDDETYDWIAIVRALLDSGGEVALAPDERILEAQQHAHDRLGVATCTTGAAGLAGLLELRASGALDSREPSVYLLTGVLR